METLYTVTTRTKTVLPICMFCSAMFAGGNVFYALLGLVPRGEIQIRLWMMFVARFLVGSGTGNWYPHTEPGQHISLISNQRGQQVLCDGRHSPLRENHAHRPLLPLPDCGLHPGPRHHGLAQLSPKYLTISHVNYVQAALGYLGTNGFSAEGEVVFDMFTSTP